ncbi:MAG: UvrD-helicase domain-containing protein, partial [Bdellovibrionales bacterium]|nr:UvrD-helicase domain-containing protein [Bdellovibrionales bacterium]
IVGAVYDRYQRELLKNNAMDFSDLLFNTLKLLKEHKEVLQRYQSDFQFVLVDEFQDTNGIQYEIIRLLAAPQNNLLAVGDDDQSIYAFRGATIENIMNFERDFPEAVVIALEQNYRSTQHILDSANAVIAKNRERRAKTLWTEGDRGAPLRGYVASDENEEAAFVAREIRSTWKSGRPLSEIAVFYRTNAQSRALEDALMAEGVPYRIYGGLKFYDRKEIKDVLAYLRLVINEADSQAFYRCINTPPRGIGAKAVETIRQKAQVEDTSLYEATKQLQSQSKSLANFVSLIEELRALAKKEALYDLISETVERSTYGPKLRSLKDVTALSRLENLEELRAIATTMTYVGESPEEDLRLFLDRVSLTSGEELPVEEARDASLRNQQEDGIPVPNQPSPPAEPPDTVSLMTLHLAKGLEYPIVFLTGLEEGLLPHYRSLESEFEISEERRLCYVGMTRAMNKLYLSRAERRGMFSAGGAFNGGFGAREASRFIFDIPETCFDSDSRHFASTGFHLGAAQFDYGQELTLEHVKRLRAQQHGTKRDSFKANPSALISQTISTADSLSNAGISADEFSKLTQAAFDDLKIGTRVIHRTFGPGEVIEVQENENVEKSKIVVQFENFELSKKLLFRHAKLAVLP